MEKSEDGTATVGVRKDWKEDAFEVVANRAYLAKGERFNRLEERAAYDKDPRRYGFELDYLEARLTLEGVVKQKDKADHMLDAHWEKVTTIRAGEHDDIFEGQKEDPVADLLYAVGAVHSRMSSSLVKSGVSAYLTDALQKRAVVEGYDEIVASGKSYEKTTRQISYK